jgi:hypothetical protein
MYCSPWETLWNQAATEYTRYELEKLQKDIYIYIKAQSC